MNTWAPTVFSVRGLETNKFQSPSSHPLPLLAKTESVFGLRQTQKEQINIVGASWDVSPGISRGKVSYPGGTKKGLLKEVGVLSLEQGEGEKGHWRQRSLH